jgi:thiamine pyrophosphate-dependent acetolactate synthase large subunit-like protein
LFRYALAVSLLLNNNNGMRGGRSEFVPDRPKPPFALLPGARYEKMIEAFGGRGYYINDASQLDATLRLAMEGDGPSIVNIAIDPRAGRKPQQFNWHTGRT